tara:strand:- start:5720 stop:9304 length:3585 start_codon:yes stop_codon:yes gene_type:complete
MTIHIPQTVSALEECRHLSNISYTTIDGGASTSIYDAVQDVAAATYLLSHPKKYVSKEQFFQISMQIRYNTKQKNKILDLICMVGVDTKIPTRMVLNMLFPESLLFCFNNEVVIKNGAITNNMLWTKTTLSHLFRRLSLDYSHLVCSNFVSDLSRVTVYYLSEIHGLTIKFNEFLLCEEESKNIKREINNIMHQSSCYSTDNEKIICFSQTASIFDRLSRQSVFSTTTNSKTTDYGMPTLISSKAKGKPFNISQMMSCLGTQIINNVLPSFLPCHKSNDTSAGARGFIKSSYRSGLSVIEMFYHQCAGRCGLIDSSISTSVSGYKFRKTSKSCEDLVSKYLQSGRVGVIARNIVLSTTAGYNTCFLENVTVNLLPIQTSLPCYSELSSKNVQIYERMRIHILNLFLLQQGGSRFMKDKIDLKSFKIQTIFDVKFQIQRLFSMSRSDKKNAVSAHTPVSKDKTFEMIYKQLEKYNRLAPVLLLLFSCLQESLKVGFTMDELTSFLSLLDKTFHRSLVINGAPIGGLASAYSSRETTQSTLNSFHQSGQQLTTGIKRSRQICELMSTQHTICYVEPLDKDLQKDLNAMEIVAARMVERSLENLLFMQNQYHICDDYTHVTSHALEFLDVLPKHWHCVLFLSKKQLAKTGLSSLDIAKALIENFAFQFGITPFSKLSSTTSCDEAFIVLFLSKTTFKSSIEVENFLITNILPLKFGIKGVESCSVKKLVNQHLFNEAYEDPSTDTKYYFSIQTTCIKNILTSDALDLSTMSCSNPSIVNTYFGIEMCLSTIIRELHLNSSRINGRWHRFIALLMCHSGTARPITSHGMMKSFQHTDVLAQASFERPRTVFANAAIYNQTSLSTNASAARILSVPHPSGTSTCNVRFDASSINNCNIAVNTPKLINQNDRQLLDNQKTKLNDYRHKNQPHHSPQHNVCSYTLNILCNDSKRLLKDFLTFNQLFCQKRQDSSQSKTTSIQTIKHAFEVKARQQQQTAIQMKKKNKPIIKIKRKIRETFNSTYAATSSSSSTSTSSSSTSTSSSSTSTSTTSTASTFSKLNTNKNQESTQNKRNKFTHPPTTSLSTLTSQPSKKTSKIIKTTKSTNTTKHNTRKRKQRSSSKKLFGDGISTSSSITFGFGSRKTLFTKVFQNTIESAKACDLKFKVPNFNAITANLVNTSMTASMTTSMTASMTTSMTKK